MGGGGGGYDRPSDSDGSGDGSGDSSEEGSSRVPPPESEDETTEDQSDESNETSDGATPGGPPATGGGGGGGAPVTGPEGGSEDASGDDDSGSEEEEPEDPEEDNGQNDEDSNEQDPPDSGSEDESCEDDSERDEQEDDQQNRDEESKEEREHERDEEDAEEDDEDQEEDEDNDEDDEDDEDGEDECLITETALLHSPNPEPLGDASEGDIYSVRLQEGAVCVVDSQGRIIGAIAEPWVGILKECIEQGRQYRARILEIDGGKCEVRVTNRCLLNRDINLTAINTAVRTNFTPGFPCQSKRRPKMGSLSWMTGPEPVAFLSHGLSFSTGVLSKDIHIGQRFVTLLRSIARSIFRTSQVTNDYCGRHLPRRVPVSS